METNQEQMEREQNGLVSGEDTCNISGCKNPICCKVRLFIDKSDTKIGLCEKHTQEKINFYEMELEKRFKEDEE